MPGGTTHAAVVSRSDHDAYLAQVGTEQGSSRTCRVCPSCGPSASLRPLICSSDSPSMGPVTCGGSESSASGLRLSGNSLPMLIETDYACKS